MPSLLLKPTPELLRVLDNTDLTFRASADVVVIETDDAERLLVDLREVVDCERAGEVKP
jgi:hypothetical protein